MSTFFPDQQCPGRKRPGTTLAARRPRFRRSASDRPQRRLSAALLAADLREKPSGLALQVLRALVHVARVAVEIHTLED